MRYKKEDWNFWQNFKELCTFGEMLKISQLLKLWKPLGGKNIFMRKKECIKAFFMFGFRLVSSLRIDLMSTYKFFFRCNKCG